MNDGIGSEMQDQDSRPIYGPPSYSPQYRHTGTEDLDVSVDLTAVSIDIDLTIEPLLVRAAFLYLSRQPMNMWADWDISKPERRLLAARWLAVQFEAMDSLLRNENP